MSNSTTAQRATGFTGSVGVNAHLNWWGSAYGLSGQWGGDTAKVLAELNYLGVDLVRAGVPQGTMISQVQQMAASGIKFNLLQTVTNGQVQLSSDVATLATLARTNPGAVVSYEGANEYNTHAASLWNQYSLGNLGWGAMANQSSKDALNGAGLGGLRYVAASTSNLSTIPSAGPSVDASNWHAYGANSEQLQKNIVAGVAAAQASAPGKPVIMTETGASSAPFWVSPWGAAGSEATQGLLDVNAILSSYKAGAAQTYLYDLMDPDWTTGLENDFGLFNPDGTAKAGATYVHNLMSILEDEGSNAASFTPGSSAISASGLPSTATTMLLQKSSGAFDYVMWNGYASLPNVPTSNVTVSLGATYDTVNVYDPIRSEAPIQTLHDVSSVSLGLSADPLIVETSPQGGGAVSRPDQSSPAVPSPALAPAVPSGSGTSYQPGDAGGVINSTGTDTVQVGAGAVTVHASGPSVTVKGGAGDLTYEGSASLVLAGRAGDMDVTLTGGDRHRISTAAGSNDTIRLGSGSATIWAWGGKVDVTGGAGRMAFIQGNADAHVSLADGAGVFTITNGHAGGALTISDFTAGVDKIHLKNFQGSGIRSEQMVGGSTQIVLTDNTRITLDGVGRSAWGSIFG